MESESLPHPGAAPAYDLRARPGGATLPGRQIEPVDSSVLERIERRIARRLRGCGMLILHDVAVPATATVIDHLCIGPNGITAIEIERDRRAAGRVELVERVARETEILAAILVEGGIASEQVAGAVCRSGWRLWPRGGGDGPVAVGGVRTVARVARADHGGRPVDVQLALAVVRNRLGFEGQRSHRVTRPDGF